MGRKKHTRYKYYVSDTESTQPNKFQYVNKTLDISDFKETRVWICGYLDLYSNNYEKDVKTFPDIDAMFEDLYKLDDEHTHVIYFHNLSWDITFILPYIKKHKFIQHHEKTEIHYEGSKTVYNHKEPLKEHQYDAVVSSNRTWYSLRICLDNGVVIEFRDSLKLLPFKLDKISQDINKKYKKQTGTIKYKKDRSSKDYKITDIEMKYFKYDLYSLAEALREMNKEEKNFLTCLTIGQYAMKYFKKTTGKKYNRLFPRISISLDEELRKAYKGGWCYVKADNKTYHTKGVVYDVNSLYPSVMKGHQYPVGEPIKVGIINYKSKEFDKRNRSRHLFITKIEIQTCKLKKKCNPWLQHKSNFFAENEYIKELIEPEVFTLTQPDFELLLETYDVQFTQLKSWVFTKADRLFDNYVDHFMQMKIKGQLEGNQCKRQLGKLGANNLYGKMAQYQINSSGLIDFSDPEKCYGLTLIDDECVGGYIPIGAFITAYARAVTVRASNKNYDAFMYSDTDSIHLLHDTHNIDIDDVKIGYFKAESTFTIGKWLRQKTYIEYNVKDDINKETGLNIKIAGANDEVKKRMQYKCSYYDPTDELWHFEELDEKTCEKYTVEEVFERFKKGLTETGKLRHKDLPTGSILIQSTFRIKK